MKIALTLFNKKDQPMLVVEFDEYHELREYWKRRRKTLPKYSVERVDASELPAMRAACTGLEPAVEEGYRLLDKADLIAEGDEWWSAATGRWETSRCIGAKQAPATVYRRPDAGDGWFFLKVGDRLASGDEYKMGDKWFPTTLIGGFVSNNDSEGPVTRYRRRVDPNRLPPAYTLLDSADRLEEGDVYKSSDGWKPVRSTGIQVGGGVGYFARPVPQPEC